MCRLLFFLLCCFSLHADSIKFNEQGPNKIGLISIADRNDQISQATWLYVKNALEYYQKTKPAFIILHLNTPGGEVFAAEEISDALKNMDIQYNIPIVAYIDNWALSAGAMIAYSSRYIAVVKDASMGAAEPVIASETGELKAASEKVNSAIRADFANRARFFDRNPSIAEAMVDKDLILVLRNGEFVKLDNDNQIQSTDTMISPKGKLLTLNAEELMKYKIANFYLPPKKIESITSQEKERGQWPAKKMLLFSDPFFEKIPNATIDEYKPDWKIRFFMLLANPVVSSILFLGMMVGFYMEMSNPGLSLPGSIAAICLFLIILSSFAQEIGNVLELIFLVVGFAVFLIEIFVLPTFGLLGFVGALLFLVGLFGLMLPGLGSIEYDFNTQTINAAGQAFLDQLVWISGTLVVGALLIALLTRYVLPKFSAFNRFVLTGGEQDGYSAVETEKQFPAIGTKGVVVSTLRPAGKVLINDAIYDAMSYGSFIEKDSPVVVAGYDAGIIQVREDV